MIRAGAALLILAMILAACSASPQPYDADATFEPDLIQLTPSTVQPGDTVSVLFPDERIRGVLYVLELRAGDTWSFEYYLISDWGGQRAPVAERADTQSFGIEDIGFSGPGPDVILIPADADPGEYRVCTGNSRPNICAQLTIGDD